MPGERQWTTDEKQISTGLRSLISRIRHLGPYWMILPDIQFTRELKAVFLHGLLKIMLLKGKYNIYLYLVPMLLMGAKFWPSIHVEMLQTVLLIEQHHHDEEKKKHAMKNESITQCENRTMFKINVPTIDEGDPFLHLGDSVLLRKSLLPESKVYCLKIVEVGNASVKAMTDEDPKWFHNEKYDVQFKVNNYPMQCFQLTLQSIQESFMTSLSFPVPKAVCNKVKKIPDSTWFNKRIAENIEQRQAVEHIISQTAKPAPYILFGPPGTGKTATLVEAVLQCWNSNLSNRILICTPSNAAADEVHRRILKFDIRHTDVMRLYSASKESSMKNEILPSSSPAHEVKITFLDIIRSKKIIITTLTSSMRLIKLRLGNTYFSYIFIDEAGQAHEPETLIPYGLTNYQTGSMHCQIVIAGDPKQLGPVIKSKIAERVLGISMLERLMSLDPYKRNRNYNFFFTFRKKIYNPNYITKLVQNFRSHGAILEVPNRLFYENELVTCDGAHVKLAEDWEYLPRKKFPIIFHAVDGSEYGESGSPSTYNEDEIAKVIDYIRKLTDNEMFKDENIGIVTPFTLQEKKIKEKLQKMGKPNINVGTVQVFQGQEKDVIIMTTVRSRLLEHDGEVHIGFLSNEKVRQMKSQGFSGVRIFTGYETIRKSHKSINLKRFNVSITRAKALLIVIGNPNVLKFDPNWRQFISHCKANRACTGIPVNPEELTADEIKCLLGRKKRLAKKEWHKKVETPLKVSGTSAVRTAKSALQNNGQSKIRSLPQPKNKKSMKTKNNTIEEIGPIYVSANSSLSKGKKKLSVIGKKDSKVFDQNSLSTKDSNTRSLCTFI